MSIMHQALDKKGWYLNNSRRASRSYLRAHSRLRLTLRIATAMRAKIVQRSQNKFKMRTSTSVTLSVMPRQTFSRVDRGNLTLLLRLASKLSKVASHQVSRCQPRIFRHLTARLIMATQRFFRIKTVSCRLSVSLQNLQRLSQAAMTKVVNKVCSLQGLQWSTLSSLLLITSRKQSKRVV